MEESCANWEVGWENILVYAHKFYFGPLRRNQVSSTGLSETNIGTKSSNEFPEESNIGSSDLWLV
jgi:hypothetical protein